MRAATRARTPSCWRSSSDDEACLDYLDWLRWRKGWRYPACACEQGCLLASRRCECAGCGTGSFEQAVVTDPISYRDPSSIEKPVVLDTEAQPALLALSGVVCEFGGVRAVDGVSFDVRRGSLTGLIGPNGAGKSTVIGAICGAVSPKEGAITFLGRDVTGLSPHQIAQRGIKRTFQVSSEFSRLTVLENLLVGRRLAHGERLSRVLLGPRFWRTEEWVAVERARELLARFGMEKTESEYAGQLSGGQRRIVELMRAMMSEPLVLVLDEPMAGVHPRAAGEIAEYLERLRDEGLTILMTEHELGLIERLCDPVVVMAQGKVISQGSLREVRQNQAVLDAYLVG